MVKIHTAQCHTIAIIEVGSFAAVAESIVYALHIHIHLRFIAVAIPHTLSLVIGRKRNLGDVAVIIIGIVGDSFIVIKLLAYLRDMVGMVHIIGSRDTMINLTIATRNRYVSRQTVDVLTFVGVILNSGLVVEATCSIFS